MKNPLKILAIAAMIVSPCAAYAADTAAADAAQETTSPPPQGATTYPCWDMMQGGHMQHMYGMMNGNVQTPPKGVKAYTCWDAVQNGKPMRMRGHMMWNQPQTQPAPQK